MKVILLAAAASLGLAAFGAQAAEEYPTPIYRPMNSSIPTRDVGQGNYASHPGGAVMMHNSGQTAATSIDGFPKFAPSAPAVATAAPVQHHS